MWMRNGLVVALSLAGLVGCGEKADTPKGDQGNAAEKPGDAKKADNTADNTADKGASTKAADTKATDQGADNMVVVYSGRGAVLVEPLFEKFTETTGIKVEVRYGKSTQDLANMLAIEAKTAPVDLFFAQDSGHLGVLAKAGHFAPLPQDLLGEVEPQFRDPEGKWVGTSGRARVLVYNPTKYKPEDLPKSLKELADPKWKGKLGWAPTNGSFQAHISALRHLWGEGETREWLKGMKALEPARYPKNSPQVKAVSNGEIDVGWVNHYYLHKIKSSQPDLVAANYSFDKGDAGNLMMVAGVGVVSNSVRKVNALQLARYLVSEEAQKYFTQKVYEYPTRPGVAPHPDVPPLSDRLVQVDQKHLVDLNKTLALLRDLGLN